METNKKPIATLGIMLFGTILGFLAQTILSTGLPSIMADLNINAGKAQWLTTLYLLVLGVMIPPTAYLIRKYSTKTLLNISAIVFTIGSLIGYLSPGFAGLLIARVLQAAGCGVILPVLNVAIFKVLPKEKWNMAMGILGLAICVSPVLGPTLGGILVDAYGWRSLFGVLLILGIIITVLSIIFTINLSETEDYPLDFASLILSILVCVGIIAGIGNISSYGIANIIVWLPLIIGIVSLVIFVNRQNKLQTPLLQLSVFKTREFTAGTIMVSVIQFVSLGIVVVLPIYIQDVCGYSATISGFVVLPATILMAVCMLAGGKLAEKFGIRPLAIVANILFVIGVGAMIFFNASTSLLVMGIIQLFRCAGTGLIMMSITTWSFIFVTDKIEDATAINNTLRQIAAAMGSAILAVIMTMVAGGTIDASANSVFAFRVTCMAATILAVIGLMISIIYVKTNEEKADATEEAIASDINRPLIITIGREYGSDGHDIGQVIAQKLNIPFYDKELVDMTAKDSGFSIEYVEETEEKKTSELYRLIELEYVPSHEQFSNMDALFMSQTRTIRKLAEQGSCIIVGRCADHVLARYSRCLNVFIYAPMDKRISRICERLNVDNARAEEIINKTDKQRASYYNHYTAKKWGYINSYDVCVNSSLLGVVGTADLITHIAKEKYGF